MHAKLWYIKLEITFCKKFLNDYAVYITYFCKKYSSAKQYWKTKYIIFIKMFYFHKYVLLYIVIYKF